VVLAILLALPARHQPFGILLVLQELKAGVIVWELLDKVPTDNRE
jgi:hypothetical protein